MVIATPKYRVLVPLIAVDPNTSSIPPTDRVSLAYSVVEQLITRFNTGGVSGIGGTVDRGVYGLSTPDQNNRPSGTLEVVIQPIAGVSSPLLHVGSYTLIAGRDYVVGGTVDITATNIAAAITNLPGYDATPVGAYVSVEGPREGVGLAFYADYRTSDQNFVFTYIDRVGQMATVLLPGVIGPIEIS